MNITLSTTKKQHTWRLPSSISYLKFKSIKVAKSDIAACNELLNNSSVVFELHKDASTSSDRISLATYTYTDQGVDILDVDRPIKTEFPLDNIHFTLSVFEKETSKEIETIEQAFFEIDIIIETVDFLETRNPKESFKNHFANHFNSKILFSAPFGQGKTTFIKKYFNNNAGYNTFHLFPVNYAIAENQDIFEYIKCELLCQLIDKGVVIENEKFSKLLTGQFYLMNNLDPLNVVDALMPLLSIIPKVGQPLAQTGSKIIDLIKGFSEYYKEENRGDFDKTQTYLSSFGEQVGGLYEENFYTQLIRHLLEELKDSKGGKENVLVIDDLDRMDPEHVFRILNVFAAHFDGKENEELNNKFGLDKVIIVCDYNNLESIFAHKYGEQTDFAGYIDKFFSQGIYWFSNRYEYEKILDVIKSNEAVTLQQDLLLRILYQTNQLSLRELLRFKSLNFNEVATSLSNRMHNFNSSLLAVHTLKQVFNTNTILQKLDISNYREDDDIFRTLNSKISYYCKDAIVGYYLLNKQWVDDSDFQFSLLGEPLNIRVVRRGISYLGSHLEYIAVHSFLRVDENGETIEYKPSFSVEDYFKIIHQIVKELPDSLD